MSTLSRYVPVDRDNVTLDPPYDDYQEAERQAITRGCAVVEYTYTYTDNDLVLTPDGSGTWPPKAAAG